MYLYVADSVNRALGSQIMRTLSKVTLIQIWTSCCAGTLRQAIRNPTTRLVGRLCTRKLPKCSPAIYKPLWVCSAVAEKKPTLYDEIGGSRAVKATVELFYDKMYADGKVQKWFEGVQRKRQEQKMISFMTCVLKGRVYSRTLTGAHAKLVEEGLGDADFDATEKNLAKALQEIGVSDEHASAIIGAVESTRDAVLGRISDEQ